MGRHGEYTDWAEPAAENEMQMLRKLDHPNVIKVSIDNFAKETPKQTLKISF